VEEELPCFGTFELLVKDRIPKPDQLAFWMYLCFDERGPQVFRRLVIEGCLPDPEGDLNFEAVCELQ